MAQAGARNTLEAPSLVRRTKSAVRIAIALAAMAIGVSAEPADPGESGAAHPGEGRAAGFGGTEVTELQRQVNELRSDLLDEREKRIVRWEASNSTVLVFLGIVVGLGGLWAYAKFRAIATVAATGVALERGYAFSSWNTLPQPGTAPASPGQAFQPVRLLVPAGPEPGRPAAMRQNPGSRQAVPDPTAVPDSPEGQDALTECTEAIRLDPDHPHAWVERGDLKARQGQLEGAIADYDRAIRLDPRDAGAYMNRSMVKAELGRHDEAIVDLDKAMRLDPDMTSTLGDL